MIAKTNTEHYQDIANEIRAANDYATFKSEIEVDNELFEDIGEAVAAKDGGEVPKRSELVERIGAIRTLPEFDMTVEDNQVKMVVEVSEFDKSFWTRFGINGGTVTVDWGDGTVNEYTGNALLEYAPQRKHNYQKAGLYLITETIVNGTLTIGSTSNYSTLSEGSLQGENINSNDSLRKTYNNKIKELSCGSKVVVWGGLRSIPHVKIHTDVSYGLYDSSVPSINIKDGFTVFDEYSFSNVTAFRIKFPSTITKFSNNSFANSKIRLFDFTDIILNDSGELPITFTSTNVFQNISSSTIFLFATQEIAEVAKNTTNLSVYADRIKYVGEVEI